jgi:hypothetical protein
MPQETGVLSWSQLVVEPLNKFFMDMACYIPDLLIAICILLTGWVVGRILQLIVSFFLRSVGFDGFAKKIGIIDLLKDSECKCEPHKWFGLLVFWVSIFVAVAVSLNRLRLSVVSNQLSSFMQFVLQLFIAAVILIAGMFFSVIVAKIIRAVAEDIKVSKPDLCAKLARYIVLVFAALAALVELGMPSQIIFSAVAIVFVTLCITFVIAFGVGGIGWASKVLDKTVKDKK